ncbi:TPA_asm: coat protein [ssRNA phage Gerhypos.1_43]|jgi:hypothetical protein|uniref:Coat protein n=2 Tax=Fiersviridae TaxID=2842319 RepID=A0A8S5KXW8_9VIRU|nr:coat protein [ssRNA phage Gerhypos.1_43]QDH86453.1 MAG: hypothetical protein H1Bulk30234_000003 [Leviviridae sp.]DAD50120.1 TPA_asm: coat protein [ssRNA phage Gerhypos.1_43]
MPAIAALTINDGAATPVAHTFSPVTTDGSSAAWADRSPSIASGFRTISHEVVGPNGNRTVNRITAGFKVPVVATINTVDTVVRYSSAQIIWNIHPDSTLQERKDLHAYVTNYCGNASVKLSIENVEPFY